MGGAALLAYLALRPKKRRTSSLPDLPDLEPEPEPEDIIDEDEPVPFIEGDPYEPGYPWASPKLNDTPTPGMFYVVETGNLPDVVVRDALESALKMAGRLDLAEPYTKPGSSSYNTTNAKRLRKQMRELITCSPWNDSLYGQTDVEKAGANYMIGPAGRGLNWRPYHANNISLLAQGLPPTRTTTLNGERIQPGVGTSHMQLWIPAVNLDMLRSNVPESALTVTTKGMSWPTGDSTIAPPPAVWSKGIVNPLGGANWGCPGVE